MSTAENTIMTVIVLLVPVGLGYAWAFYVRHMKGAGAGWLGWTTLAALVLVSLAVVM